jgi:hypothetical protein
MPYTKQTWVDQSTPLSPTRLGYMETGIETAQAIAEYLIPVTIANAAARPSSPAPYKRYRETDTGDIVSHNGTRWVKVGGPPRLIFENGNGPASGTITNGAGDVSALSWSVPAHTSGLLRAKVSGEWQGTNNAAAFLFLRYPGTTALMPGSSSRGHNHGVPGNIVPFFCMGLYNSDGTANLLYQYANVDGGGAPIQILENSCQVWLEAIPQ